MPTRLGLTWLPDSSWKEKVIAAAVISSIAVGIGANSAILSADNSIRRRFPCTTPTVL
ncbi:MAG: hypothetical protein ABI995_15245 [Acidobacteriota bacterium]